MKNEKGIGLVALILVIFVTLALLGITIIMAISSEWLNGSENETNVEYINQIEENVVENNVANEEEVSNQVPENTEQ